MKAALELTGKEKVLEIGTGSGYQTAILAELARLVITVERIAALAELAKRVLANLGYTNIETHLTGETLGWPELARLGFGATLPAGAMPIRLEGDWLDRFGALLGERGRFAERRLADWRRRARHR